MFNIISSWIPALQAVSLYDAFLGILALLNQLFGGLFAGTGV